MQEPISIKQEKIIKDMAAKYGATIAAKIARFQPLQFMHTLTQKAGT